MLALKLLEGTMRSYLLDKQKVKLIHIGVKEIKKFRSISMFNALIPFMQLQLSSDKIHL